MGGFLGQLLTASCGCLSPLLLLGFTLLIQRAPAIFSALLGALRWLLKLTFLLYRFILITAATLIGFPSPLGILRTCCTCAISVLLSLGIMQLLSGSVSLIWVGVALAHGAYLGFAWDRLADPDGLRIGMPLQ